MTPFRQCAVAVRRVAGHDAESGVRPPGVPGPWRDGR
jgi:hypothetical protein